MDIPLVIPQNLVYSPVYFLVNNIAFACKRLRKIYIPCGHHYGRPLTASVRKLFNEVATLIGGSSIGERKKPISLLRYLATK